MRWCRKRKPIAEVAPSCGIIAMRDDEQQSMVNAHPLDGRPDHFFDSRPFVRAFESSLEELTRLRKLTLRKIGELEDVVTAAESTHRSHLQDMAQSFDRAMETFEKLESRISDVGNTAILIGEQLESLDKQRLRAQESKDLVLYFLDLNQNNTSRLDLIRTTLGWEGKTKVAMIVRRLGILAKEVDLPNAEQARQNIEKYSELVEKEILHEFDQALKDNDIKTLCTCARILIDFNGGQSCLQAFVNQHEFFNNPILLDSMKSPADEDPEKPTGMLSKILADYQAELPALDGTLSRLFDSMLITIRADWSVIITVFPNFQTVLQQLSHRMFEQTIQSQVELVLQQADHQSLIVYLRVLALIHRSCGERLDQLKKFVLAQKLDEAAVSAYFSTLQRCQEDLFVPYIDNEKYLEKEMRSLQHAFTLALEPFGAFQNSRKLAAKSKGYFKLTSTPLVPGVVPAVDPLMALPKDMSLSTNFVSDLLLIHKEAVDRAKCLAAGGDCVRTIHSLFIILLENIGRKYMEISLDLVLEDFLAMDPKMEPDLRYLENIAILNSIVHLLQDYFRSTIAPLTVVQPTIHRELIIRKNDLTIALESKINAVLSRLMDGIQTWLSGILSKQKRNDFRPKDSELSIVASSATLPCNQCCEYLQKVRSISVAHLTGKNLETFLTAVCNQFHSLLLDHLKKFVINTNGGLLLTKDLAKYQETVQSWKITVVSDRFEALRQIGNIYLVKPENLKPILEEGTLSRLEPQVLHAFVANRADYKLAKLDAMFSGLDLEQAEQPTSAWENLENAFDVMNDKFGEVGDTLRKMLLI